MTITARGPLSNIGRPAKQRYQACPGVRASLPLIPLECQLVSPCHYQVSRTQLRPLTTPLFGLQPSNSTSTAPSTSAFSHPRPPNNPERLTMPTSTSSPSSPRTRPSSSGSWAASSSSPRNGRQSRRTRTSRRTRSTSIWRTCLRPDRVQHKLGDEQAAAVEGRGGYWWGRCAGEDREREEDNVGEEERMEPGQAACE